MYSGNPYCVPRLYIVAYERVSVKRFTVGCTTGFELPEGKIIFSSSLSPDRFCSPPILLPTGVISSGQRGQTWKLTTHLNLVKRNLHPPAHLPGTTEHIVVGTTLQTCIREILSSNFGQKTSRP
jgi:hypothetical protein